MSFYLLNIVYCQYLTFQPIFHLLWQKWTNSKIHPISLFPVSVEKKATDMKRQKKKQNALIYKMLPKDVVNKLNTGIETAETFDSATLFFSSVIEFAEVTKKCKALEIISFLNDLYNTMDSRMDRHDVYKVETISDSYLVASGLPKRNDDKYVK